MQVLNDDHMKLAIVTPVATSSDAAVKLVRQLRTVHATPKTPRENAALTVRTSDFLDRLADLPLTAWLATGRALSSDREALDVRQRAWEMLDAAIASHGLGFTAWSMRDAVETIAFLKTRELREWTPAERRYFASAHGAAEAATLAVLARDHLSDHDFQALVASFSQCINTA